MGKRRIIIFGLIALIGLGSAYCVILLGHSHWRSTTQTPSEHTTSTPMNGSLVDSGWRMYVNCEDHYSIRYPSSTVASITHRFPEPGRTDFDWLNATTEPISIDSVEINAYDSHGQSLANWLDAKGGTPPDVWSSFTGPTLTFTLGYYQSGGTIVAYTESRDRIVYEISFSVDGYGQQYPPFWREMLDSFRVIPASSGAPAPGGSPSPCAHG